MKYRVDFNRAIPVFADSEIDEQDTNSTQQKVCQFEIILAKLSDASKTIELPLNKRVIQRRWVLFERFPKFLVRLEQVKGTHLMRKKIKDVPRVCAGPIPRDLVVARN